MPAEIVAGKCCASWYGTYEVTGSKGDIYAVTISGEGPAFCTCPAFKFRHECKHVSEVFDKACLWNCQWHNGNNPSTLIQPVSTHYSAVIPGDKCPNCDGDVVAIKIAV